MASTSAPDTSEFTLVRKKIILLLCKLEAHLDGTPAQVERDLQGNQTAICVECSQDKDRNLSVIRATATERSVLQYSSDGSFLSLARLESYAADANPRAGTLQKIVEFHSCIWPETAQVFSDPLSGAKKYGAALGFSADEVSILIDRSVHAKPTFTTFSLSPAIAERFVKTYGGLYLLYRMNVLELSPGERIPLVSRCVLSIRNPIPGTRKGVRRVRCKLSVPSLSFAGDNSSPIYKYDGFISPHKQDILRSDAGIQERYNHACTWLFQQRHTVGDDSITDALMLISSGVPGVNNDAPATAQMLTLSQGENRTRAPYSGAAFVYRVDDTRRVPLQSNVIPDDQSYFRLQARSVDSNEWIDSQDAEFDAQLAGFYFLNKEAKDRAYGSPLWAHHDSLQEIQRENLNDRDIDAEIRLLSSE